MSQVTDLRRPDGPRRESRATGPGAPAPAGMASAGLAVDPARWPDVAAVPGNAARAVIARLLLAMAAGRLGIPVRWPGDGRRLDQAAGTAGTPGTATTPGLILHRPADFYRRVGAAGLIGFGESYMAGDWDSDDLAGLLTLLAGRMDRLVPRWAQWLRRAYVARPPRHWDADLDGARRNVQQHYDLSNEMFALFLDETMTYSSALFDAGVLDPAVLDPAVLDPGVLDPGLLDTGLGGPLASATAGQAERTAAALAAGQRRKIDRILDIAGVGAGSRVLEIGTGWGELAIRAAGRGARVRTITVSEQQQALARQRVKAAGLADRVSVDLLDYREVTGHYDAVVSVEMLEAVAERYWPEYFRALDRLLAPGGRIGLQSITMAHHRMRATRYTKTWILKYIFPGGLIPSVTAIEQNLRQHTTLQVTGRRDFGPDYARTLRIWRDRFAAAAGDLDELGFDAVFRRMWELYLAYSEAGFRSGYLQVSQFALARAATAADPEADRTATLSACPEPEPEPDPEPEPGPGEVAA
jgi:cyclopropane-fatty-acyl-phospholipid synthase